MKKQKFIGLIIITASLIGSTVNAGDFFNSNLVSQVPAPQPSPLFQCEMARGNLQSQLDDSQNQLQDSQQRLQQLEEKVIRLNCENAGLRYGLSGDQLQIYVTDCVGRRDIFKTQDVVAPTR